MDVEIWLGWVPVGSGVQALGRTCTTCGDSCLPAMRASSPLPQRLDHQQEGVQALCSWQSSRSCSPFPDANAPPATARQPLKWQRET
jgi:hypothetical protein